MNRYPYYTSLPQTHPIPILNSANRTSKGEGDSESYRNGLSSVIDSISSPTPECTHIGISSRLIHPLTTLVPSYCAEACLCPLTFTEISANPLWSWASQAAELSRLLSIMLAVLHSLCLGSLLSSVQGPVI